MTFNLNNLPVTFQRVINKIFKYMVMKGIIVFIDDILIYTNVIKQEHKVFFCMILNHLLKYGLYIAIEKYKFFISELSDLGYIFFQKRRMD